MTCSLVNIPQDGPVYAGDAIKYLIQVLDEDGLPFTGTVTAARFELQAVIDGIPAALTPACVKNIGDGVSLLPTNLVEIVLMPEDTEDLIGGFYITALKVSSLDFGEMTHVRRLKLTAQLIDLP